jgi:hypothetical protein
MSPIKIELPLAILSLLGSTRVDGNAWQLPPIASSPAVPSALCQAQYAVSAETRIPNAGDEISPADRRKIAELLQQAAEELQRLKGTPRYQTLADIAVLQAQIGADAAARENFAKVKEAIGGTSKEPRELAITGDRVRNLVVAHARAGDVAAVLTLTANLPQKVPNHRGPFRDFVLNESAYELAKNLRIKDANQVTEEIEDPKQKESALNRAQRGYIEALAKAGKMRQALQTLDSVKDPTQKVALLAGNLFTSFSFLDYPQDAGIATLQARAGNREAAERSLRQARSLLPAVPDDKRIWLTAAVSAAYSQQGDLKNAAQLLQEVKDSPYRSFALAAHVKALAIAGKTQEAEGILATLQKGDLVHALYHYAVGQSKAGDRAGGKRSIARANEVLNSLDDKSTHEHNLISAQAMAGDIAGAVAALKGDSRREIHRIGNIVWALVLASDFKQAWDVTERLLPAGRSRGRCLRSIAKAQGSGGKEADARAWIKHQTSSEDKADALLGLAEGLTARAKGRTSE